MIPRSLDAWTLEATKNLLSQGVFESDTFDFKENLPHKHDHAGKLRLVKACCAFANSAGGFLVFGVKDQSGLAPSARLVGLDTSVDFAEQFGNYPAQAEPAVHWEPKNPPIALPDARVLHIVYVPPSARKPHSLEDAARRWFCKRTSKGTESMSHEEIRVSYHDTELRRSKLALVRSELGLLREVARQVVEGIASAGGAKLSSIAIGTRLSTVVIDSVLGDAYALLAQDEITWNGLGALRQVASNYNGLANFLCAIAANATSASIKTKQQLEQDLSKWAVVLMRLCTESGTRIDNILAGRPSGESNP